MFGIILTGRLMSSKKLRKGCGVLGEIFLQGNYCFLQKKICTQKLFWRQTKSRDCSRPAPSPKNFYVASSSRSWLFGWSKPISSVPPETCSSPQSGHLRGFQAAMSFVSFFSWPVNFILFLQVATKCFDAISLQWLSLIRDLLLHPA